jgi:hypothetical protein
MVCCGKHSVVFYIGSFTEGYAAYWFRNSRNTAPFAEHKPDVGLYVQQRSECLK